MIKQKNLNSGGVVILSNNIPGRYSSTYRVYSTYSIIIYTSYEITKYILNEVVLQCVSNFELVNTISAAAITIIYEYLFVFHVIYVPHFSFLQGNSNP